MSSGHRAMHVARGVTTLLAGLAVLTLGWSVPVAGAAAGALDSDFGTSGSVLTSWGSAYDYANGVAIQSNGKIVVAGVTNMGGPEDFAVARYDYDGTLDTAFDGDGRASANFGNIEYGNAVVIQGDGKIVVAGSSNASGTEDFALARFTADGSLDPTFSGDGKVVSDVGAIDGAADNDSVRGLALLPDGRIVVTGEAYTGADWDMAVAVFTTSGALDSSFDGDGVAFVDLAGANDYPGGLVVTGSGAIVIGGVTDSGGWKGVVARLLATGALDPSFGTNGVATFDAGGGTASMASIALAPSGKVVVAGTAPGTSTNDFAIARFTTTGALDTSFGGDGIALVDAGGIESASAVAVQADGKPVVVGTRTGGGVVDVALARFGTGGAADTSFDSDGAVTSDLGSNEYGTAVVIGAGGKIVVAGSRWPSGTADFMTLRYLGDPTPEPISAALRQTTPKWAVRQCGATAAGACATPYARRYPFRTPSYWRVSGIDGTDLAGRTVQIRMFKSVRGVWVERLHWTRTVPETGVLFTGVLSVSLTPGLWRATATIAPTGGYTAQSTPYRFLSVY